MANCVEDVKDAFPGANVLKGFSIYGHEVRTEKKKVDEEMVDRIIEETKEQQKSFKERMYDKVTMPLWLLDIFIVLLVAALAAVLMVITLLVIEKLSKKQSV